MTLSTLLTGVPLSTTKIWCFPQEPGQNVGQVSLRGKLDALRQGAGPAAYRDKAAPLIATTAAVRNWRRDESGISISFGCLRQSLVRAAFQCRRPWLFRREMAGVRESFPFNPIQQHSIAAVRGHSAGKWQDKILPYKVVRTAFHCRRPWTFRREMAG